MVLRGGFTWDSHSYYEGGRTALTDVRTMPGWMVRIDFHPSLYPSLPPHTLHLELSFNPLPVKR
jgi:hypothetical protein